VEAYGRKLSAIVACEGDIAIITAAVLLAMRMLSH
jgi:hypothetical protein